MADHVTFFRMKALPGKRQAVIDQFAKWEREHKAAARGASAPSWWRATTTPMS